MKQVYQPEVGYQKQDSFLFYFFFFILSFPFYFLGILYTFLLSTSAFFFFFDNILQFPVYGLHGNYAKFSLYVQDMLYHRCCACRTCNIICSQCNLSYCTEKQKSVFCIFICFILIGDANQL